MTIENFYKAQDLTNRISELEQRLKRLRELIKRVNEITEKRENIGRQEAIVGIQVAEKWANTPWAAVSAYDFLDFLDCEIVRISKEIENCRKEFAEL